MKHHHKAEKENFDYVYYLIGILSGLFTGVVIEDGFAYILICGALGLLIAAFFVKVLAKSGEEA